MALLSLPGCNWRVGGGEPTSTPEPAPIMKEFYTALPTLQQMIGSGLPNMKRNAAATMNAFSTAIDALGTPAAP